MTDTDGVGPLDPEYARPVAVEIITLSFISLSAIFFVVDPLSAVPFFLAMTRDHSAEERRGTALRAALTAGAVLAGSALVGHWVFKVLGISLGAFRIAGGIVLLLLALDMIRTQPSRTRITEKEVEAGAVKEDIAIVPLAMPLLAGPGSIATAIVLVARANAEKRMPQTFRTASRTIPPDIFDWPIRRSAKVMGSSTTRNPRRIARKVSSIWKA